MYVKEMVEEYSEPKPHVNTVSTIVRILERKGYISHDAIGGAHLYYATVEMKSFRDKLINHLLHTFFNDSYKSLVSWLVRNEKLSLEEMFEIIRQAGFNKEDLPEWDNSSTC